MVLQAQELITALHNVCQQLESSATGKAAGTRLQKALDKLQKLQQASPPAAAGDSNDLQVKGTQAMVASATQVAAEAVVASSAGKEKQPLIPVSSCPGQQHAVSQPNSEQDVAMTDADVQSAEHSDAGPVPSALPAQAPVAEASASQLKAEAAAANKEAANKTAQKDEAKVITCLSSCCLNSMRCMLQHRRIL